ncbi:unnamed protein product [Lactuca virosa]|uniref:Transposase, Ptta/En/Spm, plant n=1 Tax=Lactuca virosa TaxID=75947 RepID=A0AAU9LT53_9ASTR|nr:unnamed protein product [Lactuca virosa]
MGYVSQPQSQQMSHRLHPSQTGYWPRPPLTRTGYGFQPSPLPPPPPLHPQRGCRTSPTVLRTHGGDGFQDYFFEGGGIEMSTPDTPVMPHTPLTPHGSASRDISGDHGSNAGDFDDSSLPIIHKEGDKFGDHSIHSAVMDLFWQSMDDAWPTYKSITEKTRKQMFARFRTKYRWYTTENEAIYTTFNNVLKERYRDRMRDLRKLSARMARRDGLPLKKDFSKYFPEIYQYRPHMVQESVWPRLCDHWSTEKWKKLSDAAQTNRNTPDSNGKTSRHTAGSIGYAEHRRRLKAQLGKDPEFCDLYVKTHGTSESKKIYFEGERENIEYCSETAKDAKDAYLEGLVMKYGEDPANHRYDAEVWVESQIQRTGGKKKGHIYGIGASDANFVVSGITSSESTRSTQSNNNTQEEVGRLREEVSNMRQLQEQMVQQMERMARMMNGTTNQANDPPHTPPHTPPEDGV